MASISSVIAVVNLLRRLRVDRFITLGETSGVPTLQHFQRYDIRQLYALILLRVLVLALGYFCSCTTQLDGVGFA